MSAKLSLIGHTFGKLKVIGEADPRRFADGDTLCYWKCVCECGKKVEVLTKTLRNGMTRSCGCLRVKHGHSLRKTKSPEYSSWIGIISRCTNPKIRNWENYGGRGITVCERWRKFENFLADMGNRPKGMSIDRIDNNGNYEPGNCRWATQQQQSSNTRRNKAFVVNGMSGNMAELSRYYGLKFMTVWDRIYRRNWPPEKAFLTPLCEAKRNRLKAS